ncbi:MAG: 4'-phosphopantetheinyl transferase superfamily protein [Flavobacteriaceae bacterium]|jgi:4'-phosphopantetheinyl transferase|nr:4'-phosphopantetheinyl transferase superfamily protein [Flavobacteriaceae bacterium]
MPLLKTINFNPTTEILVWNITESLAELSTEVTLNAINQKRHNRMKSELHQRAFLSVRKLLQLKGYTDFDLEYDQFGKPHLKDGKYISISHSHEYATIIISDEITGIDIELQREKIIKIAPKFAENELDLLDKENQDYIRKLTVIWGVKESIFKIRNEAGISFKDHIYVQPFDIQDPSGIADLHFQNNSIQFKYHFIEIDNFTLVYAFQKNK